jgi:hypothetical protein
MSAFGHNYFLNMVNTACPPLSTYSNMRSRLPCNWTWLVSHILSLNSSEQFFDVCSFCDFTAHSETSKSKPYGTGKSICEHEGTFSCVEVWLSDCRKRADFVALLSNFLCYGLSHLLLICITLFVWLRCCTHKDDLAHFVFERLSSEAVPVGLCGASICFFQRDGCTLPTPELINMHHFVCSAAVLYWQRRPCRLRIWAS